MKVYEAPAVICIELDRIDVLTISCEEAGFGDRVDFDLI